MSPASFISIGRAARIIGLPVHTVRRMADQGLIATTRTEGSHRRLTLGEALRVKRMVKKYMA